MIISQTPYRVSFAGGGTDLPAFYREEYGAVFSVAVQKHMYVTVSARFEPTTRVSYTTTEIAETIDDIQHTIVREALRLTDLGAHLEITTIGDVPAGTGMGSSSALTVGLLNALYAYRGAITSRDRLAQEACRIEIDILGKPIGRQDQYAAAYGGLNYITFNSDDSVSVQAVPCKVETLAELERHILLVYTSKQRDANAILQDQSAGTSTRRSTLRQMRDQSGHLRDILAGDACFAEFAAVLHDGWELKRSLGFGISDNGIDEMYQSARRAGALGGKLLGAGGGGFLLLMAPPERHEAIREELGRPRELEFSIDRLGSRIIFISE